MSESKALEALFPAPRRILLVAMFGEPGRWWSMADLCGRAGLQPPSLRQHLSKLKSAGIVREKTESGRAWFQPDPACPVHAELRAMVQKLTTPSACGETILIVEDQPATAQITRILLESWGYHVLEAHSGEEALALFDGHFRDVRLLLTDVIMPGMNGPEVADRLQSRNPDLRVVFMSGYPSDQLSDRDVAFLPKPFNPAGLSRMIRKELDRAAPAPPRKMRSS